MSSNAALKSIARLVLVAMLVSQPLQAAAGDPPSYANDDIITMPAYGALGYQPALDRAPMGEAMVPRFDAMSDGGGGAAATSTGTIVVIVIVVVLLAVALGGGGGGGGY